MGNGLNFQIPIVVKQQNKGLYQYYSPLEFYLSPNQDSLFMDSDGSTIPFPGDSEKWPEFIDHEEFLNYADSLSFSFEMLGISKEIDSVYFAKDAHGHLYRSNNYSGGFKLADSSGAFTKIAFDADSSVVYSLITVRENSDYIRKLIRSDDLGSENSWTLLSIPGTNSRFEFLETDTFMNGYLFLADSSSVYASSDFGENFSQIFSSEDLITGLYKKPNSDILYVLTKEELLEVNTETKQTTSLKQLPVSSEQVTNVPTQITLEQNYPNPFNPSTVISYQLDSNQLVRLEVFDVTERKVAVLVDGERKSAGQHRVTFNGSGLSSGVYFYRLDAGGQTITQKMLLVK